MEKKKNLSLVKKLVLEGKSISKPTRKQQFHGTWTTLFLAFAGAVCISALDSVFTALMGLIF